MSGQKGRSVIASREKSGWLDPGVGLWLHLSDSPEPIDLALGGILRGRGAALLSNDFSLAGPAVAADPDRPAPFCELLLDGMTYDLMLVARGAGRRLPDYRPALDKAAAQGPALVLVPGPHLATAAGSPSVVRAQWQLGTRLCSLLERVMAVGWPPAGAVLTPGSFDGLAEGWAGSGQFPSHGLIAFRPVLGQGLHSSGLAWFTGQELRLEPDLVQDHDQAVRLGLRLAEILIHRGRLTEMEQFAHPAGGTIRLKPSPNGRFVRVWPG